MTDEATFAQAFDELVTKAVTDGMVRLSESGQAADAVTRGAMMGVSAALARLWWGAASANELGMELAHDGMIAAIDQFWGQIVVGQAMAQPEGRA